MVSDPTPIEHGRKSGILRYPVDVLRAASDLIGRLRFADRTTFGGARDLDSALGYKQQLGYADFIARYERGGIAGRIVDAYPTATWSGDPMIIEKTDEDEEEGDGERTEFETAVAALFDRLDVWARVERADVLANIGEFSVLLIGARGNRDTELPPALGDEGVLYLTPIAQSRVKVKDKVIDPEDSRCGLPETYSITFDEKTTKQETVHWTRVIHVAQDVLDDDLTGRPRLRRVWNKLDDLDKVVGGGSEATWKRMDPGIHGKVDPDMQWGDDETEDLEEEFEAYQHGTSRMILTRGVDLNLLASTVPMFGANADAILKLIAGAVGIPVRILTGSERAELASSQDESNWGQQVRARRRKFAVPLVRRLVDLLIEHGVLPAVEAYEVSWPETDRMTEGDRATVSGSIAAANQAQKNANDGPIMLSNEIRERIWGLDPLEEEEPEEIEVEDPDDMVDDDDDEPEPDDAEPEPEPDDAEPEPEVEELRAGARDPEQVALHDVADRQSRPFANMILSYWRGAVDAIDRDAFEANPLVELERVADEADQRLAEQMPGRLLKVLGAGALAVLEVVERRGSFFRSSSAGGDAWRLAQFSGTFDASNPRAVEWAAAHAASLVTEVSAGTREAIRLLVTNALVQGVPLLKLLTLVSRTHGLREKDMLALDGFVNALTFAAPGDLVKAAGGKIRVRVPKTGVTQELIDKNATRYATRLRRSRALLISRTETMRAANMGQLELWNQARDLGDIPSDVMREWITAGDEDVRDTHLEMAGERVPLDQPFVLPTGEEWMVPQDYNERCTVGLVRVR